MRYESHLNRQLCKILQQFHVLQQGRAENAPRLARVDIHTWHHAADPRLGSPAFPALTGKNRKLQNSRGAGGPVQLLQDLDGILAGLERQAAMQDNRKLPNSRRIGARSPP